MTLAGLPDYIRTEWKDHGCAEFFFSNNTLSTQSSSPELLNKKIVQSCNVNDSGLSDTDSENISDEKESNECEMNFETQSPITYSVKCYFSTLNIWEYKNLHKYGTSIISTSQNQYDTDLDEKGNKKAYHIQENCSSELFDEFDTEIAKSSLFKQKKIPLIDSRLNKSFSEVENNIEIEVNTKKCAENVNNGTSKCLNKHLDTSAYLNSSKTLPKTTFNIAGVAWAMRYCQEQSETKDQFNGKNIDIKNKVIQRKVKSEHFNDIAVHKETKLVLTEKRSLVMKIQLLLLSLYSICKDSIINIISIVAAAGVSFSTSIVSIILNGNSAAKESIDHQSFEQKRKQDLNGMEVKALRCFKRNFGHLVKLFPRTPLLNENHDSSLSKVVIYSDNYWQTTRERRDELISVSYTPPSGYGNFYDVTDETQGKGLFVTYLSDVDVQNILDNQFRDESALNEFITTEQLQEPMEDILLEDNFKGDQNSSQFEKISIFKDKPTRTIFDDEGNPIKEIKYGDEENSKIVKNSILKPEVIFDEDDNQINNLNSKNGENSDMVVTSKFKDVLTKLSFDEGNPIEEIIFKNGEISDMVVTSKLNDAPTKTSFDDEGNPIEEIISGDEENSKIVNSSILKSEVIFDEDDNQINYLNSKNGENSDMVVTSKYKDVPTKISFDGEGNPIEEIISKNGENSDMVVTSKFKDVPTKISFDDEGNPIEEIISEDPVMFHKMVYAAVQNFQLIRFSIDAPCNMEIPDEIPSSVRSYWVQRHRLFLRYDDGICLDEESWYSVTPEMIAAHQAQRCACDTVIDAFCGAGGNAIQLTAFCNRVIAIDIDPKKIELARNNAKVYGVEERIDFIVGDFFELAPKLKADVVFLSPPWGGISYTKKVAYDVYKLDGIIDCKKLMDIAMGITYDVALYLPKSANIFQVAQLAGPDGRVDIEYSHISNKRKGLTAYYGDLVDFSLSEEYDY